MGGASTESARRAEGRIRVLLGMSVRALFLQNLWNQKTLQGPGFAWAVGAISTSRRADLMARHMSYFNSTPALAPCVVGAVAQMEEKCSDGEDVERFKESAGGALAAAGDQFFWGALRPLAALAGLAASPLGPGFGAGMMLVVYNVPQGLFRLLGAALGYDRGAEGVLRCIAAARRCLVPGRHVASALLGVLAGALLIGFSDNYGAAGPPVMAVAVVAASWLLLARRGSPEQICLVMLALAGVLSLFAGL